MNQNKLLAALVDRMVKIPDKSGLYYTPDITTKGKIQILRGLFARESVMQTQLR